MKKTLLLLGAAALFSSAASAQSTRLASIYSNDEYEFTLFGYDDQGRFNRVERHDYNGSIYYDSLVFNDKSQIEVDYAFQNRDNDEGYKLMAKCTYGYDKNGNVEWRDNYNSFGSDELSQSAHIVYTYDAKNRMTRQAQYWANDYENPFAIITYTYNELGQHITTVESYSDFFDPSVFTEANKNVYEYNAKGQITNIKRYSVNEGQYELANTEEFDYDDLGNVTEDRIVVSSRIVAKNVYRYNTSVDASDIYYPASHEYNIGRTFGVNSQLEEEDIYADADDDDVDEAIYAYTLIYHYEANDPNKVEQVTSTKAYVDANAKEIHFGGDVTCVVSIYGQDGKLVLNTSARGKADLSTLPAGMYIARVQGVGTVPSFHKFVIK